MRPYSLLLLIGAVAMVPLTPGGAHAAPPTGKSDVATDKARQLHMEGDELYKQGDYERARVSYVAAWALKKNWQLAGSLGDCELKLGFYRDAAEHLAYFLRSSPTQPPSDDAMKLYKEAQAKVSRLDISVDLPGADVVVDGKFVGKSPLVDPIFVEPGPHTVELRLGEKLKSFQVDLAKGVPHPMSVALAGSGEYSGPKLPIILGGAGLGLVALAAGIGFTAAANGKSTDAKTLRGQVGSGSACFAQPSSPTCVTLQSAADSKNTLSNLAMVSFIAGGAFALTSAGLGVWSASSPKTGATVRVAPVVGASQRGILVVGSW